MVQHSLPSVEAAPPHLPVRAAWLALRKEPPLDPEREIVDSHHHLWDRPKTSGRYMLPDFLAEINDSGHRIVQSVYVQARSMYRTEGPDILKPVGEVEFASKIAKQTCTAQTHVCSAIVGCADLTLGEDVDAVLHRLIDAGEGRLKGIRFPVAFHADPNVRASPGLAPSGLLLDSKFQDGARRVAAAGLSLDVWVYHTQLAEVSVLARAIPDLNLIIDHAGGPLGVGPYEGGRKRAEDECFTELEKLASLPNVFVKIGGLAMGISGFRFHEASLPPTSDELASVWEPVFQGCIDLFGASRCMFESNFPVDKGMVSYGVVWNAFKRLASSIDEHSKQMLFAKTARKVYGI